MSQGAVIYTVPTSEGNVSVLDSQGVGKPVLFIHGNSACKEAFFQQFESSLSQKYRFIAMDLPGHGGSDNANDPENTYTISGYADVAIEVIKNLALDLPVVVGWSLGGHIGLNLVQKSQKLAGLLITGTPPINISGDGFQEGFLPLPLFQNLFKKKEFTSQDAVAVMSGGGIDAEKHRFLVEAALRTDGNARYYLTESLGKEVGGNQKKIVEVDETPLCIVQGEKDQAVNNKYILEKVNYKNLFNRQVYLVENTGHAVFLEKPEEFNEILSQFLSHLE